jgi:putative hydrolase of the HAD superfamily
MTDPVRAVFFDVGGTLIRPWPSVGAVYAQVAADHGIEVSAEQMERAFRQAWRELKSTQKGETSSSKAWWRQLVFQALAGRATEPYFEDLYERFARAEAWRIFDDVLPALAWAREQGWHVGLISNWDERLRPLLSDLNLDRWDSVTISCEVGAEKPAAAIFRRALAAAGVPARAALHVGDSIPDDVRGATALGMRAGLVDREQGDLTSVLRQAIRLPASA